MIEALTVKELYTLDETIAKDIFDGVTYPWEVLPKISSFILELGNTLSSDEYEKIGENVWIANPQRWLRRRSSMDLLSSEKMRRCATVHSSAAMPLWARERLWEIPRSLRM